MKGYTEKEYHFVLDKEEFEDFKKLMNEHFLESQQRYRYLKNRFLAIIKGWENEG